MKGKIKMIIVNYAVAMLMYLAGTVAWIVSAYTYTKRYVIPIRTNTILSECFCLGFLILFQLYVIRNMTIMKKTTKEKSIKAITEREDKFCKYLEQAEELFLNIHANEIANIKSSVDLFENFNQHSER